MNKNNHYKKIAYLGIAGSYSFIAAQKYFGSVTMSGKNSFTDIFKAVSTHQADAGIVPLENSLTGSIYQTYDLLNSFRLKIVGEIILKIRHCLLINPTAMDKKRLFAKIWKCYSHPEAIKQCQAFFDKNKQITPVYTNDTASAAKKLAYAKELEASAIASRQTAKIYNLSILDRDLADNQNNYTRFVLISSNACKRGDKVSLIFSVKHMPGSLVKVLEPYAKYGLNLTKIESRPVVAKPWEYIFFVDLELNKGDEALSQVLKEMKDRVNFIKILGRYKKGETHES